MLIRRLKKWDFELCKFQFKGGILLSIDVFVISLCLANKWFIKNGMAVSGLHTYYWVWSGPKLRITVLEEMLGDACAHHMGKQCAEKWSSGGSTSSAYRSSQALFLSHIITRHPHRWLYLESPVFSSEAHAAEALSTQTRGEATWYEVPQSWQVLPAVSPAPLEKCVLQIATAGENKLTTLKYLLEK